MLYTKRLIVSFQFFWTNSIPFTLIPIQLNGFSSIHNHESNESLLSISNYKINQSILNSLREKSENCVNSRIELELKMSLLFWFGNRSAVVVVIVAITHETARMVVAFFLTSDSSIARRVIAEGIWRWRRWRRSQTGQLCHEGRGWDDGQVNVVVNVTQIVRKCWDRVDRLQFIFAGDSTLLPPKATNE